jgi:predicted pyridoxine 5'-phosphate oxidase superfamily flavin-nucleotide-binding protein
MTPLHPDHLVDFLESGVSILLATADAEGVPEAIRACGVKVDPQATTLSVFVPSATAALTLSNLAVNPLVALNFTRVTDDSGVQVKGRLRGQREARADERGLVDCYLAAFTDQLFQVGMPRAVGRRMLGWPAVVLEVNVGDVFVQTPGPGAGRRLR